MGELHVALLDGVVDVFVDDAVGNEPGNPTGGARASYFRYEPHQFSSGRLVVVLTQVDVDLRCEEVAVMTGQVEITHYLWFEWTSAFRVGDGDGDTPVDAVLPIPRPRIARNIAKPAVAELCEGITPTTSAHLRV